MDYRPIDAADLETCADVFYAADDELMARRGLPLSPRNRPALLRLFGHISATSRQRAWLAEERGEVAGFGMAVERGELVFLSFLFLLPDHQARGIGRALLERCMFDSEQRAVCIFSAQPVSAALYAMYGMVPRVPIYAVVGRPRTDLPDLPPGLRTAPLTADRTAELDQQVVGFRRLVDHGAWQAWERRLFGLFEAGRLVGYGYSQSVGRLGPVVVERRELLLPFVGQLLRAAEPVESWLINVPGPAAATFAALTRAGMQLDGPPVIFCSSHETIDHSRYLPSSAALP